MTRIKCEHLRLMPLWTECPICPTRDDGTAPARPHVCPDVLVDELVTSQRRLRRLWGAIAVLAAVACVFLAMWLVDMFEILAAVP